MKYSAILAVSAGLALPAAASRLAIRQEAPAVGSAADCPTNDNCRRAEDIQGSCEVQNPGNFIKQADCICQGEFEKKWRECRQCLHANEPKAVLEDWNTKLKNALGKFCAGNADKSFADYFNEAAPGGQPGSGGQESAAGQPGSGGQGGAAGQPASGGQGGSAGQPGSGEKGGAAGQSSKSPATPAVTASSASSASSASQGGSGGAGTSVVGSTATQKTTAATATSGAGGAGAAAGAGASGNNSTTSRSGSSTSSGAGSRSTDTRTGAAAPKAAAVGSAVLMAFAGVAMMVL